MTQPTPLLRGWSHLVAIVPAAVAATALVLSGPRDAGQRAALALYGAALILLFTISALYHRGPWSPRMRAVWRRVDHANIFLMIAATYTAAVVIILSGTTRIAILLAVWIAATTGIVLSVLPLRLPRAIYVLLYVITGWIAIVVLPAIIPRVSTTALIFMLAGGAAYTLGALVYGFRRPRLWPRVFGYHEVFHLLVIAASALFFAFVALAAGAHARV
jgi:hemolysin III